MKIEETNTVGWNSEAIQQHVFDCHEEIRKLRKGLDAVSSLMDESRGVCGLHLNGDEAPWSDLRSGGFFESWLIDFDTAIE